MTNGDKKIIIKVPGKEKVKVKGKDLKKKYERKQKSKKKPKYCPNCGELVSENFCELCGTKLS